MEYSTVLAQETIDNVKKDLVPMVCNALENDLIRVVLYGSCARGDFSEDSDIDIALLTKCDRMEAKKYLDVLAEIATELAKKYLAIVNFVCLPKKEFDEKKSWYPYFKNIEREGELLYGR